MVQSAARFVTGSDAAADSFLKTKVPRRQSGKTVEMDIAKIIGIGQREALETIRGEFVRHCPTQTCIDF